MGAVLALSELRLLVAPAAAFLLCAGMAVAAAVWPVPRPDRGAPIPARVLVRYLLGLAAGGYAALLGIVAVFHGLVVGDRRALADAAVWGLALAALAVPAFLALTLLERRVRRR